MRRLLPITLIALYSSLSFAADISQESLHGKWVFTHMILDGTSNQPINLLMEFLPNGEVINYDRSGNERSRASYTLENGVILYTDNRGKQNWRVLDFTGDRLHVDHRGAEMFFEKR